MSSLLILKSSPTVLLSAILNKKINSGFPGRALTKRIYTAQRDCSDRTRSSKFSKIVRANASWRAKPWSCFEKSCLQRKPGGHLNIAPWSSLLLAAFLINSKILTIFASHSNVTSTQRRHDGTSHYVAFRSKVRRGRYRTKVLFSPSFLLLYRISDARIEKKRSILISRRADTIESLFGLSKRIVIQ